MGKVLMEITMSLDGYTAGPDVSDEAPSDATATACTSGCSLGNRRTRSTASKPTTSPTLGR